MVFCFFETFQIYVGEPQFHQEDLRPVLVQTFLEFVRLLQPPLMLVEQGYCRFPLCLCCCWLLYCLTGFFLLQLTDLIFTQIAVQGSSHRHQLRQTLEQVPEVVTWFRVSALLNSVSNLHTLSASNRVINCCVCMGISSPLSPTPMSVSSGKVHPKC